MGVERAFARPSGAGVAHRTWATYGAEFNGWAIPDNTATRIVSHIFIRFEQPEVLRFLCKATEVRDEHRHAWATDKYGPDPRMATPQQPCAPQ